MQCELVLCMKIVGCVAIVLFSLGSHSCKVKHDLGIGLFETTKCEVGLDLNNGSFKTAK